MLGRTRLLAAAVSIFLTAGLQILGCGHPEPQNSEGPGNGGGGDPRVAAFLDAASAACSWMQMQTDLRARAEDCRKELADLTASVNDRRRVHRVYSDDQPALDNGTPKDAVTDLDTRRIHINIARWGAESELQQQVTAAMEMSLLLAIPDRYTLGKRLTAELAASVSKKVSPAEFESFQKWAKKSTDSSSLKTPGGSPMAALQGQTNDHLPCILFITDKGLNEFYISLGVGPEIKLQSNDLKSTYIGGVVIQDNADLQMNSHEIHFREIGFETIGEEVDGSPIGQFTDRRLHIELNESGRVLRVTGTTSRLEQPVVCKM